MNVPLQWTVEPAVIACLVAPASVYAAGVRRMTREQRVPSAGASRALAFCAGIGLLVVALLSPLDAWAERSFAAHMAQHLILMMIAPPLLVLGRPIVTALWALPGGSRRAVAAWWNDDILARPAADFILGPMFAWVAASAALWFWHLPVPYAYAYDDAWAHALEHLAFFFGGVLFWRVVIGHSQSRRLSLGATMLFVATFAMHSGMLGALLIFGPRVFYAVHAIAPPWSPFNPLEDQQLAGILMWLVNGAIDLGALAALFVAWLASSERRALPA